MKKHLKSDMHLKAVSLKEKGQMTLYEMYSSTPIGQAISGASAKERGCLAKLFDLAYLVSCSYKIG